MAMAMAMASAVFPSATLNASAFFSYGDRSSHTTTTSSTRNRSTTPQRTRRDVRLYLSRREWIALSFCFANEVFLGRGIDKRANATEEDEEKRKDAHTKQESQSQESKSEEEKAKFEAKENKIDTGKAKSDDDSSVNPFLSLFDPNEKTKEGKSLPKGYLKSARLVVKSLKESIGEESKNEANIRRSADSAKGAIRDFLQNWRGQKSVSSEESYKALESAFKILGKFYAKEGPRALLPSDVKSQILEDLKLAEAHL